MSDVFKKILDSNLLTSRRKQIFEMKINGFSCKVIGEEMGVSKQRISQLLKTIDKKIRNNLSVEHLNDYIIEIKNNKKNHARRRTIDF